MAAILALVCLLMPASGAQAQGCYLNNPFGNYYDIHGIGHPRSGGARRHKGADVMICQDVEVPIPSIATSPGGSAQPCNIIPNADNPIINGKCGYGLYMRFDCGNNIEVRYAHLNGFNASTQMAINGRTGASWTTPSHVHWEIYIDNHAVDPTCAVGMERNKIPCRSGIPASGVNVCDSGMRSLLKADAVDKLQGSVYKYTKGAATSPMTNTKYRAGVPGRTWPTGKYGDPCTITCNGEKQCVAPNKNDPKKCPEGEATEEEAEKKHEEGGEDFDWETIIDYDGTGIVIGDDEDAGEKGGKETPGKRGGKAHIPPLIEDDGEINASCAVDTWVALANQSALEARRETMMNKRFIAKADSVIEFGCLAFHLKKTENEAAAIFSETDMWSNFDVDLYHKGQKHTIRKTLGTSSMDSSLMNVVWAAHENYKKNFNHALMGGLENYAEKPNGENCADMQKVWTAAKCQNFPAPSQVFLQFKDLVGNDVRQFPPEMPCSDSGIEQLLIDAAKNKATEFDKVKPKLDYLTGDGACKPPILTGITVYRNEALESATAIDKGKMPEIKTYEDAVCSNAGCSYDNPSKQGTGQCVRN